MSRVRLGEQAAGCGPSGIPLRLVCHGPHTGVAPFGIQAVIGRDGAGTPAATSRGDVTVACRCAGCWPFLRARTAPGEYGASGENARFATSESGAGVGWLRLVLAPLPYARSGGLSVGQLPTTDARHLARSVGHCLTSRLRRGSPVLGAWPRAPMEVWCMQPRRMGPLVTCCGCPFRAHAGGREGWDPWRDGAPLVPRFGKGYW